MSRRLLRQAIGLASLAVAAATLPGCKRASQGPVQVIAIGDGLKVRDPAIGPLSVPQSILVQNVAQGLVRFDASGNIVGGLAERWNVSDDGLSYIFRIASAEWPDGTKITAQQVARELKRELASRSRNELSDSLGAVEEVVAMTDRVIEIRLRAPRPNLLSLLAQPQMGIFRNGFGSGPFAIDRERSQAGALRLVRSFAADDDEARQSDELLLSAASARDAVAAFAKGSADLVLGGTFIDLPYVRSVKLPRNVLRFDPASGLFGLAPLRTEGPFGSADARRLLSQSLDRDAIVAALAVPNLAPRTTLLEPGLDGIAPPAPPAWTATPLAERLPRLQATSRTLFGKKQPLSVRVYLPEGPGADLLLQQLQRSWAQIGLTVERSDRESRADFMLVDLVAPSSSPAWFVRRLRCGAVRVCDDKMDELTDAARQTQIPAERYAMLAQAAAIADDKQLFLPITAPIRWSLVSARIASFAGNRFARHSLMNLQQAQRDGD